MNYCHVRSAAQMTNMSSVTTIAHVSFCAMEQQKMVQRAWLVAPLPYKTMTAKTFQAMPPQYVPGTTESRSGNER